MNAILVANGPSAILKHTGKLINSFDKVVRFNNFVTYGYTKQVGSKTDLLFTCDLSKYTPKKLFKINEVIITLIGKLSTTNPKLLQPKNFADILDWDFSDMVGKEIGLTGREYPSTGIIAIYYCLNIKKWNVTITGFDNFKRGRSAHYNDLKRQDFPVRHNGAKEKKYIQRLMKQKQIRIL